MEILERSAVLIARAVSVVTDTLDVDRVVFGGPFWSCLSEPYLATDSGAHQGASATRKIHAVEVVGTGVGEDVGAVGAACLVLEHTLAPRSQRLLLEAGPASCWKARPQDQATSVDVLDDRAEREGVVQVRLVVVRMHHHPDAVRLVRGGLHQNGPDRVDETLALAGEILLVTGW